MNVSVLGQTAITAADGTFTIAGVPTLRPALVVRATLSANDTVLIGFSAPTQPVRGGTTEVGDIVVTAHGVRDQSRHARRTAAISATSPCPSRLPSRFRGRPTTQINIDDGYLFTDGGDYLEAFCCDLTLSEDGGGGGGDLLAAAAAGAGADAMAVAADAPPGLYVNDQIPGPAGGDVVQTLHGRTRGRN